MAETWTVLKILQWTAGYFKEKGIEGGRLDAEVLLANALGLDRVGLYLNFDRPLSADEQAVFRQQVSRRARREPVQYILGETEFWSLALRVSPDVLIPRADTEVLVEEALKKGAGACSLLDVGTGSGAIAVALASELPEARIEAVDLSSAALAVASDNARRHGVDGRIVFREADLYGLNGGPFDLILSNPPYIPTGDMADLMPEVRDFEPQLALRGGDDDGLAAYRSLAAASARLLHPGGWLLVEVGIGQADAVRRLFEQAGLSELYVRDDYAGVPRVVGGRKPVSI
ncbi:peptide chain release factor N(5)-glutamine methyltransferase [Trichloromonas sp.]|uniref:peptide chain release factor N(5)-glutamine methyltransferase n=1 Tax=Trichloromonas sp. TaxID=3069249 RepID=UPI003D819E0F